MRQALSELRGH